MHSDTLELLTQARRSGQPVVLITRLQREEQSLFFREGRVHGSELTPEQHEMALDVLSTDRCRVIELQGEKIYFQPFNPPLRLVVVGAVHIARVLITMARSCGYRVTLIDPRRAFATDSRFPDVTIMTDWPKEAMQILKPDTRTAIVTLTHDPKIDDPALEEALRSDAFYIGSLGSRKTHAARLERLAAFGFDPDQYQRIHGPIGLDIGAQSPEEIAVSILAEIITTLRRKQEHAV